MSGQRDSIKGAEVYDASVDALLLEIEREL